MRRLYVLALVLFRRRERAGVLAEESVQNAPARQRLIQTKQRPKGENTLQKRRVCSYSKTRKNDGKNQTNDAISSTNIGFHIEASVAGGGERRKSQKTPLSGVIIGAFISC